MSMGRAVAIPASCDHNNCTKQNVKGWCQNRSLLLVREKVCRIRFGVWKERKWTAELYSSCASCFYSVIWRDSEMAIKWGQALETMYLTMMQKRGRA